MDLARLARDWPHTAAGNFRVVRSLSHRYRIPVSDETERGGPTRSQLPAPTPASPSMSARFHPPPALSGHSHDAPYIYTYTSLSMSPERSGGQATIKGINPKSSSCRSA
jgi:hypothetical protein